MLVKKSTQSKKHSNKPKSHHPIFHFDAILISLPPGTVSNSVNSWKNVAKWGSCNMICSTRACSKVNFFSFPRSCKSYREKRGRKGHEWWGILSCTCTSTWETTNHRHTQKRLHPALMSEQRPQDSNMHVDNFFLFVHEYSKAKEM